MHTNNHEYYELNSDVAHREIEGQVLLLTPDDDVLYTLNGTGKLAWELLASGASPREIAARIAATYAIDLETAERDVAAFLDELERRGVVSRRP
jgi:hypothetical protein